MVATPIKTTSFTNPTISGAFLAANAIFVSPLSERELLFLVGEI